MEGMHVEERRASLEPYEDQLLICPHFHSYSSLGLLTYLEVDEDECRLIKLNNTIEKLSDLVDASVNREDTPHVFYLLNKFLKYNGSEGYYVKHLPQISKILEFVALRSIKSNEYLDILYQLLELCLKPLLLQRSSEALICVTILQRYFSLLGYLLIRVPTRQAFIMVKTAIEALVTDGESQKKRRDAVKPDTRREAVETSKLPVTLNELAEVAPGETYPDILEIILTLVSVSPVCCYRFLETGVENQILLKMHSLRECECLCFPAIDDVDLQLDKEDYYKSLECSTKILWRLMKSTILLTELPECLRNLKPPSRAAMRNLRVAFRREVLRAGRCSRSRKLRNELANLILANLVQQSRGSTWRIVESGIADDLANLVVATEFGTCGTWAETAIVETDALTGLTFKKTLLLIVALIAESRPDAAEVMKNKRIVSGVLQLVNPSFATAKMLWNFEQLWHLFKYASNALTFLTAKIADEFIEDYGSLRLLSLLERFAKINYDELHVMCLAEMMCSLSSANCDTLLADFRKHKFIPVTLRLVDTIFNFDALTTTRQEIVTFLLVTSANILEKQKHLQECNSALITKTAVDSLQKCLHQKPEDSELKQSFLVSICSFIQKCLASHPTSLSNFLTTGGLYLILDLVAGANLPVQNLYLGLLRDICENEVCSHYLFSWRCTDKSSSFVSLLANIWRDEERTFGVERTPEGCIRNVDSAITNDDEWLYLYFTKSVRDCGTIVTSATKAARPKIYDLLKLSFRDVENDRRKELMDKLSLEDRITMLTIDAYIEVKANEATLEISRILEQTSKPYSTSLDSSSRKLLARATRLRDDQGKLLELRRDEENRAELDEFRRIRDSRLNPAFDALRELRFIAGTSRREYLLEKRREAKLNSTVFGQSSRVKSISKPRETKEVSMVSPSTSPLSPGVSLCSTLKAVSDSSFFCRPYEFDENGNVNCL